MRSRRLARFDESDVVQLTCFEAYRSFEGFRGTTDGELLAWLQTILRRKLASLVEHHSLQKRDYRREAPLRDGPPDSRLSSGLSLVWNRPAAKGPGPVSQVITGERAVHLALALDQLPSKQRRAIQLRFLEAWKLREIAEEMRTTTGCVAGWLRQGLRDLEQLLSDDLRREIGGNDP